MNPQRVLTALLLCCGAVPALSAVAAEHRDDSRATIVGRHIDFELTFANRDLMWLGDSASPTASVCVRSAALPIATDCCVTTTIEHSGSAHRRYYREARIVKGEEQHQVLAFTSEREKHIGAISGSGAFTPNQFYIDNPEMLSSWPADASQLAYDSAENAIYRNVPLLAPMQTEVLDFLPFHAVDAAGKVLAGQYSMSYQSDEQDAGPRAGVVSLLLRQGSSTITVASAEIPRTFRRDNVQLCSFDNWSGGYCRESDYRTASVGLETEPAVTFRVRGTFDRLAKSDGKELHFDVMEETKPTEPAEILIDGNFDDWRNVVGVDDPRGDLVPYLDYVSDVDILEFKVAHDDQHLYLYARVAGQVGRTHPDGGRGYFYAYLDVDRNPSTGFVPSRDDECYYGVDLGDDCEVQFEFVGNKFRKSFYGFCGLGGDDNVLKQEVELGKSQYGRLDSNGVERTDYKSEYIYREGVTEITEDLKEGTSDSIRVAISPDGSEVEVSSKLTGFLKDRAGEPTVRLGQSIDVAVGMECDSKAYPGKTRWAADNTRIIRSYRLSPAGEDATTRASE